MTNLELNNRLYDKMAEEQAQFKAWLLKQSPETILDHSYEYCTRADILISLENNDLTDEQALALLYSPDPLSDVYRDFTEWETGRMDNVWNCLEDRANHVAQELRSMRELPVYREGLSHAQEQGELKPYRTSHAANVVCKNTIEQVIAANYENHRLDAAFAFAQLNSMFGPSRLKFVLATTIRAKQEDGRISPENKRWAQTVPVPMDECSREYVVDRTHPGLINLLVNQARAEWAQEKTAEKKPSVRDALQAKGNAKKKSAEQGKKLPAAHRKDDAR